ncbi:hypothetical protein LX97_03161 [Nonlabens dokdonensis]|jgi:hypothetical protein|uniref:Uncharacterized protein n=2 Tax=Nonlabens dokdonensis TaxID=328515 RepID=L7W8P4_NONDD|nr:DUF6090 family protein [Nonlabens dokdonensis]AGC78075.1 hypothetical protein DDD_2948 [Nonlabens dokdonensis DSW-6]PZX37139.1 hypothetical protein LX97_03161 [Nonlabens dokdonensis]
MIKFFRKIRQNLLSEGKTGKYFKYAIGEIVLVVIGILIALSINNLNEQRKANIKEQAILKRLEKEFISNRKQLLDKIELRNTLIESCRQLLENFDNPENASRDSVFVYLSTIQPPTFDPIQNDLVSSGNIEILKNEELKQMLVNWSTDVIQLQEVERIFLRFCEQEFYPYSNEIDIQRELAYYYYKNIPKNLLDPRQVKNLIPGKSKLVTRTTDELLKDVKLEGMVAWSLTLNMFNNQESETLMKRINSILNVLDAEIKK